MIQTQKNDHSFWKNGAGELVAFLTTLPVLLFVLIIIVSITEEGTLKERLEYEAYRIARAAVVCTSETDAEKTIKKKLNEDFRTAGLKIISGSQKAELTVIPNTNNGKKKKSGKTEWVKGNYIRITVSAKIRSIYIDFGTRRKSASITMMIENPAYSNGGDYPWAEDMTPGR